MVWPVSHVLGIYYIPLNWLSYGAMLISLILGLLAFLHITLRDVDVLIKVKGNSLKEPTGWMFLIIVSLIISTLLLLNTPLMALGNFSVATGLTAFASFLACFYAYLRFILIYFRNGR